MDEGIFVVRKESNMLWTIIVILLILCFLGLVSGYTMGGVIHILLVIRHRRGTDPGDSGRKIL